MNEKLILKIKSDDLEKVIKTKEIFDWNVTSKEENNDRYIVTFVRDTSTPYYQEIKLREKKWKKTMEMSYTLVYIFVALSLLVITSALVVKLSLKGYEHLQTLIYILLGSGVFLSTIAAVLFMLEVKRFQKIIPVYLDKRFEMKKEIEEIKKRV